MFINSEKDFRGGPYMASLLFISVLTFIIVFLAPTYNCIVLFQLYIFHDLLKWTILFYNLTTKLTFLYCFYCNFDLTKFHNLNVKFLVLYIF